MERSLSMSSTLSSLSDDVVGFSWFKCLSPRLFRVTPPSFAVICCSETFSDAVPSSDSCSIFWFSCWAFFTSLLCNCFCSFVISCSRDSFIFVCSDVVLSSCWGCTRLFAFSFFLVSSFFAFILFVVCSATFLGFCWSLFGIDVWGWLNWLSICLSSLDLTSVLGVSWYE